MVKKLSTLFLAGAISLGALVPVHTSKAIESSSVLKAIPYVAAFWACSAAAKGLTDYFQTIQPLQQKIETKDPALDGEQVTPKLTGQEVQEALDTLRPYINGQLGSNLPFIGNFFKLFERDLYYLYHEYQEYKKKPDDFFKELLKSKSESSEKTKPEVESWKATLALAPFRLAWFGLKTAASVTKNMVYDIPVELIWPYDDQELRTLDWGKFLAENPKFESYVSHKLATSWRHWLTLKASYGSAARTYWKYFCLSKKPEMAEKIKQYHMSKKDVEQIL